MNFVLFIHEDVYETGNVLEQCVSNRTAGSLVEKIHTFNALRTRLKRIAFYGDTDVFILLADTRYRLAEFVSLMDFLADKRLILVIPDDSEATLTAVHKLFPRYFTVMNETYDDLGDVVNKMIQ